jgi:hypothetical protein
MPVRWTFVSRKKLFKVVGEGDISRADVDLVLDAMLENGFLGCRKLVDLRQSELGMTGEEMLEVGVRVRSMHGLGKMGPLAMVLPEDRGAEAEPLIGKFAVPDRPMRVFRDFEKATRWLAEQKPIRKRAQQA